MDLLNKILGSFSSFFSASYQLLKVKSKEYPYLTKSLILHFCIIIFVSGAIPSCKPEIKEPKIITVDIVPMQPSPQKVLKQPPKPKPKIVKKEEKKVEKKEKPKPKPKQVKKTVNKPVKKEKKVEVKKEKPEIKKESPLPNIKKPEEVKKKEEEKKKNEDKTKDKQKEDQEGKKSLLKDLEKKEEESLDDLIKEIDKDEEKEKLEKPNPEASNNQKEAEFVPNAEFVNEIMSIVRGQISSCWSIPIGAKNVDNMRVILRISLDRKGNVTAVKIVETNRYASDNFYRVLADSAVWAIKECSPLRGLPEDKHKFWQEIEFTFDPSMVL